MFNLKKIQFKGSIFEQVSFPLVAFTFFMGIVIVFLLYSFISKEQFSYKKQLLDKESSAKETVTDFMSSIDRTRAYQFSREDILSPKSKAIEMLVGYGGETFSQDLVRDNLFRALEELRISVFSSAQKDSIFIAYGKGVQAPFSELYIQKISLEDLYVNISLHLKKPMSAVSWNAYPEPLVIPLGSTIANRATFGDGYSLKEVDEYVEISGKEYVLPTIYYQETYFDNHGTVQYVLIGLLLLLIILCGYVYQYVIIRSLIVKPLGIIKDKINSAKSPRDLARMHITVENEIGDIARALSHVSKDLDDMYKNLRVRVDEKTQELKQAVLDLHERLLEDDVLLREMSDGLLLVDNDGIIEKANTRMGEICGNNNLRRLTDISLITINNDETTMMVLFEKFLNSHKDRDQLISYDTYYGVRNGVGVIIPLFVTISHIVHDDGRHQYLLLVRDITEELSMSREKNEFVSFASHQLKTPMTNILWITEGLKSGLYGEVGKKLLEPISDIHTSSKKMVSIVNTLLQVSRLEMGVLVLHTETVSLCEVIDATLKDQENIIHEKSLSVQMVGREYCISMNSDPQLLRIVFDNLIGNAVKYSHDNGSVTIEIKNSENKISISISDTGIGIPKIDLPNLFKKMKRGSNIETTHEGNGLGLYMVKLLLEKLKGEIELVSEVNKGTTVTVNFATKNLS